MVVAKGWETQPIKSALQGHVPPLPLVAFVPKAHDCNTQNSVGLSGFCGLHNPGHDSQSTMARNLTVTLRTRTRLPWPSRVHPASPASFQGEKNTPVSCYTETARRCTSFVLTHFTPQTSEKVPQGTVVRSVRSTKEPVLAVVQGLSPHGEQNRSAVYKRGATEAVHDRAAVKAGAQPRKPSEL